MTYVVKQRIRGRTYAYEVVGYWDPVKKQARQRRRYLGVWDEESGTIKPKAAEREVRTTRAYGAAYLLKEISEELELPGKLVRAFGEKGNALLALAFAKVLDPSSLRNTRHIMEDTCIPEFCGVRGVSFSSQWLSDLLESLSRDERGLAAFHSSLIGSNEKSLVYDITSLTSYSKGIDWLEYGDDYRKVDLPQVNLGLVLSVSRKIPIYHKVFPGSITDVVTLKNLVLEVKALGVRDCVFILDRGFYSESNVLEMLSERVDFVMPLPFTTRVGRESISETNFDIESVANARRYGKEVYYVLEKEIPIGGKGIHAYILFNKRREADEVNAFYNRLMDIEAALDGKKTYGDAYKHFERVAGRYANYFEFTAEKHVIRLRRKPKAIAQAVNRMGKMILLSSRVIPWDEALTQYRERDALEKTYDDLKNDLEIMPLRVRKKETFRGLLLVYFVAMILRSLLLQRARKAKLLEKSSVEEILREMSKLRAVNIGNTWKLTEITKKQRTILEKMKITIPLTPENLVIKTGGV